MQVSRRNYLHRRAPSGLPATASEGSAHGLWRALHAREQRWWRRPCSRRHQRCSFVLFPPPSPDDHLSSHARFSACMFLLALRPGMRDYCWTFLYAFGHASAASGRGPRRVVWRFLVSCSCSLQPTAVANAKGLSVRQSGRCLAAHAQRESPFPCMHGGRPLIGYVLHCVCATVLSIVLAWPRCTQDMAASRFSLHVVWPGRASVSAEPSAVRLARC